MIRGEKVLFDINTINNIKEIEGIKVDILKNISDIYGDLNINSCENNKIKDKLVKNIELTKKLADILHIEF